MDENAQIKVILCDTNKFATALLFIFQLKLNKKKSTIIIEWVPKYKTPH